MYLAIPSAPDCVSAWLAAVAAVDGQRGHEAYNVILDVDDPTARSRLVDPVVAEVDAFLKEHADKGVETVANTIFPEALYHRHKAPLFFKRFEDNVLPRVSRSGCWSGYYFERMMRYPRPDGKFDNQLEEIISRIKDPTVSALNKFEISIYDPLRDVDKSPYGGQCLSFASLKLIGPATKRQIAMTAFYRNHYYIEKLLGNLIGLGRLLAFLAKETGLEVGPLTIVSTHAVIDTPSNRSDLKALLKRCDLIEAKANVAA
ncbi:MAG: hypothetical protein EOP62_02385 [Sphingomonadales bacterium]|nr:MAG: hypothetical protein EOP62_02385 [Sphingomonadales bacterium]